MAGRIVKPQELKDGGDQSQAASGGDYCRPIATKRRTGGNLAADCGNVGQRLVEIAHLMPQLYIAKYTHTQSKRKPRWITAMCADGRLIQWEFREAKITELFQQYKRSKFCSEARQSFWGYSGNLPRLPNSGLVNL
jgi:hypothetical protein